MKKFLLIFHFFFSILAHSKTLEIIMPDVPSIFDPIAATDVFSLQMISQIHRGLFGITSSGTPQKILAKNVNISSNQMKIEINKEAFSKKKNSNFEDVKFSIENAIRRKVLGFSKLRCLQGYANFIHKNTGTIEGIQILLSSKELIFKGPCNFSNVIRALADVRFSIYTRELGARYGLGRYTLKQLKPFPILESKKLCFAFFSNPI